MIISKLTLSFPEQFGKFNRRLRGGNVVDYPLLRRASIKDIIESMGVPHTEVGRILIDREPVGFDFIPSDNHKCRIEPIQSPYDVLNPSRLRPRPLMDHRFIADVNVGKLALLLRIVGLDTAFDSHFTDDDVADAAVSESRIVLSKDTALLKRKQIVFGRYVRAVYPDDQLREVIDFFGLQRRLSAFSRCVRCNSPLVGVEKNDVIHRLEPKTRKYFFRFKMCRTCDRIYWKGSHHQHMIERLKRAGIDV